MPQDPSIEGHAVQWGELPPNGRRIVSANIREAGMNLTATAGTAIDRMKRGTVSSPSATMRHKNSVQARFLAESSAHFQDKPVTLQRAANRRQEFYNNAIDAKAAEGNEHNVIPAGSGWYFEHHRDIAASASEHGFPTRNAIAASGVMSPQNSPENEKAAVHAIMDTLMNHKVHVTQAVADHLSTKGIDVQHHVGKTVSFDNLPTGSVAQLSGPIRDTLATSAPLKQVSRGGTKQNIAKAESVLWGEVKPEEAVNPHSAPKVWSYVHNTLAAEPGSLAHTEYMGRVHQDALVRRGQLSPHQSAIDVSEGSQHPLLSPHSHTVEDTWQNAATFDQPMKTVGTGRTSVYKAAGSMAETYPVAGVKTTLNAEGKRESAHPDARVGSAAITHAFNNRATQKAAEQQGRGSGVSVPPVAMQEVGWTQMRREAGKDPAYNQREQVANMQHTEIPGQQALFGEHVSGSARLGGEMPEEHHDESDVAKWAAIGANHGKSRRAADRRTRGAAYSEEFNRQHGL